MTRPFRDITRAQLAERERLIESERQSIMARQGELDREIESLNQSRKSVKKTLFGSRIVEEPFSLEHSAKLMPLLETSKRYSIRRQELAQESQDINVELHIRDSPDLVKEFGPGAD